VRGRDASMDSRRASCSDVISPGEGPAYRGWKRGEVGRYPPRFGAGSSVGVGEDNMVRDDGGGGGGLSRMGWRRRAMAQVASG